MINLESIKHQGNINDRAGDWESFQIFNGDTKVGSVIVRSWANGAALITRLDIDEAHRNSSFGTQTIELISASFDECYIAPDNADAVRLCERLGSKTHKEPWIYLDRGFGVFEV